jgi:glycosyltransferase involved in cell wall biosynthesis
MMLIEEKPLPIISCLLVTANGRLHHVQRSVKCYLDQTYPNRELIIVNEGPKEYQEQLDIWLIGLHRPDIRTVWLDGYYTLGALRNISISMSVGAFYCQWDDDDFCTPQRLTVQYTHLINTCSKACFLTDQLHYYFFNKELYWDNWSKFYNGGVRSNSVIPGTIMISRDLDIRYPSSGRNASAGEDSNFAERLFARCNNQISMLSNKGYMHVYSCHGDNQVYPLEHHLAISKHRSQLREDVMRYRAQICETINYLALPGDTKVMCRDGLAFVCKGKDGGNIPKD